MRTGTAFPVSLASSRSLGRMSGVETIWFRRYLLRSRCRCLKFWLKFLGLEETWLAERLLLSVKPTSVLFLTFTARAPPKCVKFWTRVLELALFS